jgi:hypothetical protein
MIQGVWQKLLGKSWVVLGKIWVVLGNFWVVWGNFGVVSDASGEVGGELCDFRAGKSDPQIAPFDSLHSLKIPRITQIEADF